MPESRNRKFKFHILGLSHLPTSLKYVSCAFTQKVHKLCAMLMNKGHAVILYGGEGSDAECTQFVQTYTMKELRECFGDKDYKGIEELGYDYKSVGFRHDWNNTKPLMKIIQARLVYLVNKVKKSDDFLLLPIGNHHEETSKKIGLYLTCESGIGYRGSFARFRSFESSYIRDFTYGSECPFQGTDGKFYDRVIPNYFRMEEFDYVEKSKDYYVYFGRIISRKGVGIAYNACKHLDAKLIIAGQGWDQYDEKTRTLYYENTCMKLTPKMKFFGFANSKERNKLLGNAIASFCPSVYQEPFCGVNVESQLCGTPVITTEFGAFTQTVEQGKTGFRCDTLNDFVQAAIKVKSLDRKYIRTRSAKLYSCEAVNEQFEKWWQDLYEVWESTTKTGKKGFSRIHKQ